MKFILLFFFTSFFLVDFLSSAAPSEDLSEFTEEPERRKDTDVAADPPCNTIFTDSDNSAPPPCNLGPIEGSRRWRCTWTKVVEPGTQGPMIQEPATQEPGIWKPCGFRIRDCKTNCDYRTFKCKTNCTFRTPNCITTYT